MNLFEEVSLIIGNPRNEKLEYKAVLPPARVVGQMISGFANHYGGLIILGVAELEGKITINGLSEDFNANSVTHKAIDLLSPKPVINYEYINYQDKKVYVIKVEKSNLPVSIEGKTFLRNGNNFILKDPPVEIINYNLPIIIEQSLKINSLKQTCTNAKSKFLDHYQSVLNIIGNLGNILYPVSPNVITNNQEGKILIRILFSSCADNFETYLSDLLYEIYLAKPDTLKSNQQVSIKEVLDCSDMQEFVIFYSKKKLSKLSRGSVKAFINENTQINSLNVITPTEQDEIEKILQIRHLYAHRNGIIDEKFLQYYSGLFNLNDEHKLTITELLKYFSYLLDFVDKIDKASIQKYQLSFLD